MNLKLLNYYVLKSCHINLNLHFTVKIIHKQDIYLCQHFFLCSNSDGHVIVFHLLKVIRFTLHFNRLLECYRLKLFISADSSIFFYISGKNQHKYSESDTKWTAIKRILWFMRQSCQTGYCYQFLKVSWIRSWHLTFWFYVKNTENWKSIFKFKGNIILF